MTGSDATCLLCSRVVASAKGRLQPHLDMAIGIPCRGSGVPVGHTWDAELAS